MFGRKKLKRLQVEITTLRAEVHFESTHRQAADARAIRLTSLVNDVVNRIERDFPCRCVVYQPKCARCSLLEMIAELRKAPMYGVTLAPSSDWDNLLMYGIDASKIQAIGGQEP